MRIEEQVGSETLEPELLQALKEKSTNYIQEILKAQNEKDFLSEEAIQKLQSNLITSSLLSFQEQLQTERQLAADVAELEKQRELERQRIEEERARKSQEQQLLEQQKQEERKQQALARQRELEVEHKKLLITDRLLKVGMRSSRLLLPKVSKKNLSPSRQSKI